MCVGMLPNCPHCQLARYGNHGSGHRGSASVCNRGVCSACCVLVADQPLMSVISRVERTPLLILRTQRGACAIAVMCACVETLYPELSTVHYSASFGEKMMSVHTFENKGDRATFTAWCLYTPSHVAFLRAPVLLYKSHRRVLPRADEPPHIQCSTSTAELDWCDGLVYTYIPRTQQSNRLALHLLVNGR